MPEAVEEEVTDADMDVVVEAVGFRLFSYHSRENVLESSLRMERSEDRDVSCSAQEKARRSSG